MDLPRLFADYADHHRHPGNKATHFLGIPVIAAALLGLGSKVPLLQLTPAVALDLGHAIVLGLTLSYLTWHRGLALGVGALLGLLYLGARPWPTPTLWIALAVGVGLQYLGHFAFEHRAPAFHRNLIHTLVGPLWVAASLFRRLGLYRWPTR